MPLYDLQASFTSGEVSPEAYARTDIAKYKNACKTMRNFIPSAKGPAYRRPGTRYVAGVVNSSYKSKLIPFIASDGTAVMIEVSGGGYFRFYESGVQVGSDVASPYSESALSILNYAQSGDTIFFACAGYAPRKLVRNSSTSWTLSAYAYENGPFLAENTVAAQTLTWSSGAGTLTAISALFNSSHVGALFKLIWNTDGQFAQSNLATTGDTTSPLACGGTWRVITSGTWNGTLYLERSDDLGSTYHVIQSWTSLSDINVNTFGTEDRIGDLPFGLRLRFVKTSGTCVARLSVDGFESHQLLTVTGFTSSLIVTVTPTNSLFTGSVPSPATTSEWAEGAWSDYRGYPASVSFFQDRMTWALGQTLWFTKVSDYVDFGRSLPLQDDDGITINLLARKTESIKSLVPFSQSLVSLTDQGEWNVSSIDGGAITPTNIYARLQGNYGSGIVYPLIVGSRIIFIQPKGTKVRDMDFQFLSDKYVSEDISVLSDHLFKGYTILDMAYQREPDSLFWLVRSDGVLLSCAYLREQEVLGWSRHDTNAGTDLFESVATIPGTSGDEVWVVVKRGSARYLERMLPLTTSTDVEDQYYADCGFVYDSTPVSSLSGKTYLNGYEIVITADGFVLNRRTVSAGIVKLGGSYSVVQAGIPIVSDLEPLNPNIDLPDGTFQGRAYTISRAVFRFFNSLGGSAGSDSNNLVEIDTRDPDLAETTPTPLFSGFFELPIKKNSEKQGRVFFRQSDSMPATILSIVNVVEPGALP